MFNFTQHVKHKGKQIKVDIPEFAEAYDKRGIKCTHCSQMFVNQQGLSVHIMCKHRRYIYYKYNMCFIPYITRN